MLLGHVLIEGVIECVTGLHIGAASDTIEIGGIDSTVVRNPFNREPYIPGSSLKGKMRSLMEMWTDNGNESFYTERHKGILRHECDNYAAAKECPVCSLFGSTGFGDKNEGSNFPGPLLVCDGKLHNPDNLKKEGLYITEAKMENTLHRITSSASPRTIERVPAGAKFKLKLVLRVQQDTKYTEQLKHIFTLLGLIERDGLGGSVSRGYGQVSFAINQCKGKKIDGSTMGGLVNTKDKEYSLEEYSKCIDSIKF